MSTHAEFKETGNQPEHELQLVNENKLSVTNRQKANSAPHFTC